LSERWRRRLRRATLVLGVVGLWGCRAQEDEFYARIWPCRRDALGDQCGPTRDGKPMVCFNGAQLGGGTSFCTEKCDPAVGSADSRFVCLSSGALLRSCRPNAGETNPSLACPAGLSCLRTSVLLDVGVCVDMPVCNDNSQCGSDRQKCAATLLRDRLPASMPSSVSVMADHLECLQDPCSTSASDCPSGESCLASYVDISSGVPDICVPNCDRGLCPPGFACANSSYAPGSPTICLPGLPGTRCTSNQDCLFGDCFNTDAGFSICSTYCLEPKDCTPFNSPGFSFLCIASSHHCLSTQAFQGPACVTADDCAGLGCYDYSPYVAVQAGGECRVPCDGQRRCPARGGVPHVCLAGGAGGCYPGLFGLPCADSSECIPDLVCAAITSADARYAAGTSICTTACLTDDDCDMDASTTRAGFCQDGLCHLGGGIDAPCTRPSECLSDRCSLNAAGQGTCLDTLNK